MLGFGQPYMPGRFRRARDKRRRNFDQSPGCLAKLDRIATMTLSTQPIIKNNTSEGGTTVDGSL